jgi:hypothetical protein
MPLVVPLQPVPFQTVAVTLNNQSVQLDVYTLQASALAAVVGTALLEPPPLFMDVLVNNQPIIGGVICQNLNRIVRSLYLGFIGDFTFLDNSGNGLDPSYAGLGSIFSLIYLFPSDLNPLPTGGL